MDAHGSTVWRVCLLFFRASADAEDAFQETMIKYATADTTSFNGEEHRKAWLIRVATNVCKDMLKAASRSNVSFDEEVYANHFVSPDSESQPASFASEVVDIMQSMDDPPRTPLYLSLYEGYTAPEIADMVDAPVNTVYSWLARGKTMLKEALA
ncbi:MAG: sigma-70 family RNA polymerase sigma factor [Gordonibacter sp.]|uniref:RNA polymerase sigma factor n=1 Tax=Gordonibacter sp. TaxID=1968902 RepID=UPI002FC8CAA0